MTPDRLLMLLAAEAARGGQLAPQLDSDQARQAAERLLAAVGLTHSQPPRAIEAPPVPDVAQHAATEPMRIGYRRGQVGVPPDGRLEHDVSTGGGKRRYGGWTS